jgi:hypothetical protein
MQKSSKLLLGRTQTNPLEMYLIVLLSSCSFVQSRVERRLNKGTPQKQKKAGMQYTTTGTQWDTRDILCCASDSNDAKLDRFGCAL